MDWAPPGWMSLSQHQEDGAFQWRGRACSVRCMIGICGDNQGDEGTGQLFKPRNPAGRMQRYFCKWCDLEHAGLHHKAYWWSIALYNEVGARFWLGSFCCLEHAGEYCENKLVEMDRAA